MSFWDSKDYDCYWLCPKCNKSWEATICDPTREELVGKCETCDLTVIGQYHENNWYEKEYDGDYGIVGHRIDPVDWIVTDYIDADIWDEDENFAPSKYQEFLEKMLQKR